MPRVDVGSLKEARSERTDVQREVPVEKCIDDRMAA